MSLHPTVEHVVDFWRFQLDQDEIGERESWFASEFDRSDWASVPVPSAWDHYDLALRHYEGVAWFATEIPSERVPERAYHSLHFQSVSGHAKVWVNGTLIGEHIERYMPFEFAVHKHLQKDVNSIVIRVDNAHRKEWLPGGPVVEWVQYGGILQPVKLISKNLTHVSNLSIVTEPTVSGATVCVVAEVTNHRESTIDGTLTLSIQADGRTHQRELPVSCDPYSSTSIAFHVEIENLSRWDLDHTVLHTAEVQLQVDEDHVNGGIVDVAVDRFGFRTFTISNHQFLLNDKPIPIHGVNRYDEYEPYGVTVPEDVIRQDLLRMKKAGVNFVRVHYPQDPVHLRIMDEIGLLFLEEIPINWWRVDPNQPEWAEAVLNAAERELEGMVRRDKNHPCLVVWSMANESDTDTEIGVAGMKRLIRKTRELDPTRLVTFVVHTDSKGHDAFDETDFIGINLYFGLFHTPPASHIEQFEEAVQIPTEQRLRGIAAQYPDKPIVMTEFGTHGIKGLTGNARFTETYQSAYIRAVWQAIENVPSVQGGVLWAWADYYHQRDFIGKGPGPIHSVYGPYGVVTIDRKEKSSLATLAELFGGE